MVGGTVAQINLWRGGKQRPAGSKIPKEFLAGMGSAGPGRFVRGFCQGASKKRAAALPKVARRLRFEWLGVRPVRIKDRRFVDYAPGNRAGHDWCSRDRPPGRTERRRRTRPVRLSCAADGPHSCPRPCHSRQTHNRRRHSRRRCSHSRCCSRRLHQPPPPQPLLQPQGRHHQRSKQQQPLVAAKAVTANIANIIRFMGPVSLS